MTTRKSTGKRLRFEVFKRDYFTCLYCGNQPPDVVVDHIVPVAKGGQSTIDNLITACEACNQGKADKPLGDRAKRPDADLMYLQAQQEINEMKRYQLALQQREVALKELVISLQDAWYDASGLDWYPSDQVIRQLINRYPIDVAGQALMDVAGKLGSGYLKKYDNWIAYMYTVAKNLCHDEGDY